jgi:molecular chaperone GrpE (heat shock protein)
MDDAEKKPAEEATPAEQNAESFPPELDEEPLPIDEVNIPNEAGEAEPAITESSGEATCDAQPSPEPASESSADAASDSPEPAPTTESQPASETTSDETPAEPKEEKPIPEIQAKAVELLFGRERFNSVNSKQFASQYAKSVAASEMSAAECFAKLAEQIPPLHAAELETEQGIFQKATEEIEKGKAVYDTIFTELATLVSTAGAELEKFNEEDSTYTAAPEGLQAKLTNYKKGMEIVHRMLDRAASRKKELDEFKLELKTELPEVTTPTETDQFAAAVLDLADGYHDVRDDNHQTNQEARRAAEKAHDASLAALKQILSAVDGIDNGSANEVEVRATVAEFEGEEANKALIETWFGVYGRLTPEVDKFFEATGITAQTVEVGTPFDPDTMEPQGTVENAELNNEDVATVIRRGFSLHGKPVRPMLVDVVRNP